MSFLGNYVGGRVPCQHLMYIRLGRGHETGNSIIMLLYFLIFLAMVYIHDIRERRVLSFFQRYSRLEHSFL